MSLPVFRFHQPKEKVFLMDGAMGTTLLAQGFPLGSCFELLNLTEPNRILKIHKSYLQAGAQVLVTNTFGANPIRLQSLKVLSQLEKINRAGVRLAKKAASGALVFASIGPLGIQKTSQRQRISAFQKQAQALEKEKPNGYLVETMTSLLEAQAAVQAVRNVSKRPLIVCLVFPKKIPSRGEMKKIATMLRKAGTTFVGTNCGTGPEQSYQIIKLLSQVDPGPFCVRPSAGLPGQRISPQRFAAWAKKFKKLNCEWIGGCCGTTPEYIRALKRL